VNGPDREPGCIFCSIIAGESPATVVFEDERTLSFMDVNPATEGHALVVPRRHGLDLFEVPAEDAAAMWRTARLVAAAAKEAYRAPAVNLLMANGREAFQTVFHAHVHVVPRYRFDELHLPWIPRAGDRGRIAANGERLRAAMTAPG